MPYAVIDKLGPMSNTTYSSQGTILASGEIKDWIIERGVEMLRNGANAADVAEQVARDVEDDADDHSVGFSGLPNCLGMVECDASFMDGATLRAGAVGALVDFRHPISVARAIMERTQHVLLVGEGATRFAREIEAEPRTMLTPEAETIWWERLQSLGVTPDALNTLRAGKLVDLPKANIKNVIDLSNRCLNFREGSDTMNVIVRDGNGHIVSAVTTSGIAWKYPGRLGDSPILGAGNYADNRYGAAACMGLGELTIRHGTCLRAIMGLQMGQPLDAVGQATIQDLWHVQKRLGGATVWHNRTADPWIRMLLIDTHGNCGAYSTADQDLTYKVQRTNENKPTEFEAWKVQK